METTENTSSSNPSDDDNEALFAEADANAAQNDAEASESDDDDDDDREYDDDDSVASESDSEAPALVNEYGVRAEGTIHEFHIDDARGTYTFKGHVQNNMIIIAEDVWRETSLPGTDMKGELLAHHRGQTLPLEPYKRFADFLKED